MSTVELKEQLIEKIRKTDNEIILEEVYRLLDIETSDLKVYYFSDEERNEVKAAVNQINNGQYITNVAANKEIEQWLEL